jgi:hypothetical protein
VTLDDLISGRVAEYQNEVDEMLGLLAPASA